MRERIQISAEEILDYVEAALIAKEAAPSLTELSRLLELREQIDDVDSGALRVGWVRECDQKPSGE
jgi:hypothetical protein